MRPGGFQRHSKKASEQSGGGSAPVSEVQNGLDGVPPTCGDVALKAREQGQKHIDPEALPLPGERGSQGQASPEPAVPPQLGSHSPPAPPS